MNVIFYWVGQISINERLRGEVPAFADMDQHPYGWLSLVPPLVAILLAILTRRVILSLLIAVCVGALILGYYANPNAAQYEPSGWDLIRDGAQSAWYDHLWPTLLNPDKVSVFVFTCLMGGIVGMVNRAAGMRGLIALMAPIARSRVGLQVSTWLSGMLVFFDDYANTMLLGTTYRTAYDRLKISREKLAFIVDSTAAPVAGLAIVSTWIAGELDYINQGMESVPLMSGATDVNAFGLFVASIPYRFYVLWALFFVLLVAVTRRDFGPMWKAEQRAFEQDHEGNVEEFSLPDQLEWHRLPVSSDVIPMDMTEVVAVAHDPTLAPTQTPARSLNAILPILVTVVAILGLMYQTGWESYQSMLAEQTPTVWRTNPAEEVPTAEAAPTLGERIRELGNIFGSANSYASLVWGSVIGFLFTWFWLKWQRVVSSYALAQAAGRGAAHMVPALAILWLASTLSTMTGETPSQPYQAELDRAQAIAEAIAGVERVEDRFRDWDKLDRVHETLKLQGISDDIIVETMVRQFQDPEAFFQRVISRIEDQAITPGFYARYLNYQGQQVDWEKFIEPSKPPEGMRAEDVDPLELYAPPPGVVVPPDFPGAAQRSGESQESGEDSQEQSTTTESSESKEDSDAGTNPRTDAGDQAAETATVTTEASAANQERKEQESDEQAGDDQARSGQEEERTVEADADSDGVQSESQEQAETAAESGAQSAEEQDAPPGGGPPGGGGGGGGGMSAMFAERQADPSMDGVWETLPEAVQFPYTDVRHRLHTGRYLSSLLSRWVGPVEAGNTSVHPFAKWLPTIVFILAAFTAFATGTSWGTMGIVMPLAIPLVAGLLNTGTGIDPQDPILLATIASVLAGAIFGDHCSPISDTTVLSSNASGCSHLAHVWTQMPYALTVAGVTIIFGTIPVGFGLPWWLCLGVGTAVLIAIVLLLGRPVGTIVSDTGQSASTGASH
jgi:Na+/H+ antiporter NhaC